MKKLKINMTDLLDAFDQPVESESQAFLDTETGEVLVVGSEFLNDGDEFDGSDTDDENDFESGDAQAAEPEWMQQERERARRINEGGERYKSIEPLESYEAHRLMEDFIQGVDDARLRERLGRAIQGRGAFRRFKDTLQHHDQLNAWFAYEQKRKLQYARDWLESLGIEPE